MAEFKYLALQAIHVTRAGSVYLVGGMEDPVYDVTGSCAGRGMELLMRGYEACDPAEMDGDAITADFLPPGVSRPWLPIPGMNDDPALVAGYFADGLIRIWVEPNRAVAGRLFGI